MESVIKLLKQIRPEFEFSGVEDLLSSGMLDSFDITTLVAAIEEQYGVTLEGDDIVPENFRNVEAIVRLIAKYGVTM